jgi:hypothetical protein
MVAAGGILTVSSDGFIPGEVVKIEVYEGADLTHFDGPYLLGSPSAGVEGKAVSRVTVPKEVCCTGATVRLTVAGEVSHRMAEQLITIG